MNTSKFIGKLILNSFCSLFYFGFKYIWKLFKNMRSKPLFISQIKAVIMIILPVFVILRYPLHIIICIYCVAAMCYGLYVTYQDEVEYEKAYYNRMSILRNQELVEAIQDNRAEEAAMKAAEESKQEQPKQQDQTPNGETVQ